MNLTIGDKEIYVEEAALPAFTFSPYDLLEPGKIKGSNSTTLELPATREVRLAFGGPAMSEQFTGDLDARLSNLGFSYFKGRVRPLEWDEARIKAGIVGDNAGWMPEAKKTKLPELDLGESPVITADYQRATWTDETDLLAFPLICYGSLEGDGNGTDVNVATLRPAVRVKHLLKRAFDDLGYSIDAAGTFATLFPKLIIPNTVNRVTVPQQYLDGNVLDMELLGGPTPFDPTTGPVPQPLIPTNSVITDPGTNLVLPGYYGSPYDLTLGTEITLEFQGTYSAPLTSPKIYAIAIYDYTDNIALANVIVPVTATPFFKRLARFHLPDMAITAGHNIGISLSTGSGSPPATFQINEFRVTYTPLKIYYQEGLSFDIASSLPNLTVFDVIKGVATNRGVLVKTDEQTKTVTLKYYDEVMRRIEEGEDWTDRVSHEELPQKLQHDVPLAINFLFKHDEEDRLAQDYRTDNIDRSFGDRRVELEGGISDEKEVELPFAATHMGTLLEQIYAPIIRKQDGTVGTDYYDHVPRLLILDGVTAGSWTHSGDVLSEAPNCYFVKPNEFRWSLSFADETLYGSCALGSVSQSYSNWLKRTQDGRALKVLLLLHDEEVATLDIGIPRMIHDGYDPRWYYIHEITQHRYGQGSRYTSCKLIPV